MSQPPAAGLLAALVLAWGLRAFVEQRFVISTHRNPRRTTEIDILQSGLGVQ
jgi:hypothetical protein